jgi:hemin uptake protein HemP
MIQGSLAADELGLAPMMDRPEPPTTTVPTSESPSARAIDVERLMAGSRECTLVFRGESYRLRITANQRLILTK